MTISDKQQGRYDKPQTHSTSIYSSTYIFNTQRSDIYPPANTPNSEDKAIEIVDIGPATEISIDKLSEKRVGNQFFAAQPGVPGTQK